MNFGLVEIPKTSGPADVMLQELKMPTGTVKWFNAEKGFGFITPDGADKDVFVHITAVRRAGMDGLNEGDRVRFEIQPGRDGRTAAEDLAPAD